MINKTNILRNSALIVCLGVFIGCTASGKKQMQLFYESEKDNCFGKVINDSLANIILNAKRLTCELVSKSPEDIERSDTTRVVPKNMIPITQFLFFDINNFKSNDVVYGQFVTWAYLKFESRKHRTVYLHLDFGLCKWKLLDKEKNVICTMDMKENNMQFLRFLRLMFPYDKTLNILYNNLTSKQ